MSTRTDTEITADVLAEMTWGPAVNVTNLCVRTSNGFVTLHGTAAAYADRDAAVTAAYRVRGVRGVNDEIVVGPAQVGVRTDADIEDDVRKALTVDTAVPLNRVGVSVANGVVTLTGTLDYCYQRKAAEDDATGVAGVQNVINVITVSPKDEIAEDVADDIASAFARHAELADDNVTVSVEGGKVILDGTVRTWNEYKEAEEAAWRAPGVKQVDNRILVAS